MSKQTHKAEVCDYCDGKGTVDIKVYRSKNFSKDLGVIRSRKECEECHGTGEDFDYDISGGRR